MTNGITVSGNVTLYSGMGISGAWWLTVNSSGTLTWWKTRPNALILNWTSKTFTLWSDWINTWLVTLWGTTALTMAGSCTMTCNGWLTVNTSTANGANTSFKIWWGTITLTTALQCNLEIAWNCTLFAGTNLYNTWTLKYTSGTVTVTSSTLSCTASTTFNTTWLTLGTVSLSWTSQTFTLSSAFQCWTLNLTWTTNQTFSGAFDITCAALNMTWSTTTYTLTGNISASWLVTLWNTTLANVINWAFTISCAAGLTLAGTTSVNSWTASIKVTAGTITSAAGVTLKNNLELAGGSITMPPNVFLYNTWTLKYTSWTITWTSNTISSSASTTFTLAWTTPVNMTLTWTSQTFTMTNAITISWQLAMNGTTTQIMSWAFDVSCWTLFFAGTTCTYTLSGNYTSSGLVTLGNTTLTNTINGVFTITCQNGLTFWGTTSITLGTTAIKLTWWTMTGVSTCSFRNNFEIAWNCAISGNIYYNTWIFKYTSGTVNWNTSVLNCWLSTTLNLTWTIPYAITLSGTSQTFTLQSALTCSNLLTLTWATALNFSWAFDIVCGWLSIIWWSVTYTLTWNITSSGLVTLGLTTSTSTINWVFTITCQNWLTMWWTTAVVTWTTNVKITWGTWSGAGTLRNNFEIAGNITINGSVFYNSGLFKYTSGTVTVTSSTLTISLSTITDFWGITLNNLILWASGVNVTLKSNLILSWNLTSTASTAAAKNKFLSDVWGTKRIITLLWTCDCSFLDATDINSSLGNTIFTYKWTISNSDNRNLLPTYPVSYWFISLS